MTTYTKQYIVHGEYKETNEYVEKVVWAINAKDAYEEATRLHPDIKFVNARRKGCNCSK